jgi:hypothetical protein
MGLILQNSGHVEMKRDISGDANEIGIGLSPIREGTEKDNQLAHLFMRFGN